MRNRTNFNYVHGTAARSLDAEREEPVIVSYREAKHARSNVQDRRFHRMSDETRRELMGAECALSKAQYAAGTLICFGGGLLMIMLERMFS